MRVIEFSNVFFPLRSIDRGPGVATGSGLCDPVSRDLTKGET